MESWSPKSSAFLFDLTLTYGQVNMLPLLALKVPLKCPREIREVNIHKDEEIGW